MAEVLTQSQIDALLSEMDSPTTKSEDTDEKKAKPEYKKYDFYSPKKFTKDRLKVINGIYDNYTRMAASRVNSVLRANCEMEVVSVEEQRYFEFSNALSDNDIIVLQPLYLPDKSKAPPIVSHMSSGLMLGMIDRLLGGSECEESPVVGYTYTEIEKRLYEKMMQYLLDITGEAWSQYLEISTGKLEYDANMGMFQEVTGESPVVIVLINVKMNEVMGRLTICIPGNLLANVFAVIDKRRESGSYEEGLPDGRELILEKIRDTELTVKAELGKAMLSLSDICSMRPGDVIDLKKSKDATLTLYVEEQPWFECDLGAYKKHAAVKIDKNIKKEVEGNE
ncbi:flagellar motor switch protein FliM [Lachnospiraceae bacterium PF1-21]